MEHYDSNLAMEWLLPVAGIVAMAAYITYTVNSAVREASAPAGGEDMTPIGAVAVVFPWMFSSILLTLYNKWLMSPDGANLPYPLLLTLGHMLHGTVVLSTLRYLQPDAFPGLKKLGGFSGVPRSMLLIGALFMVVTASSNFSYLELSVALINMLKCANPLVAVTVALLLQVPGTTYELNMLLSLLLMSGGAALTVNGEPELGTDVKIVFGLIALVGSVFLEQVRMVMYKKVMSNTSDGLDPLSAALVLQPISLVLLVGPALYIELPKLMKRDVTGVPLPPILVLNGFVAVALNVSYARMLKKVSAITFTCCGTFKDAVTVFLSLPMVGGSLTSQQLFGYAALILSFAWYTKIKAAQQDNQVQAKESNRELQHAKNNSRMESGNAEDGDSAKLCQGEKVDAAKVDSAYGLLKGSESDGAKA